MDAARLEEVSTITAGDPGEMLRAVATSAAQVRAGVTAASDAGVERLAADGRPRAVVLTAMGTGAMAGDLLAALAGPTCPMPVLVSRGGLPGWVGAADTVVALCYSGTTVETLAATEEAARRGASVVGIGAAGSPFAERVERARGVFVPVGAGHSSRARFWALATPLIAVGGALRLVDLPAEMFEATAVRLYELALRCQPSSEPFLNPAKDLALTLAGAVPLACGTSPVTGVAASRLAAQWAQTAKAPAIATLLPEAAHTAFGAVDGPWVGGPDDLYADRLDDSASPTTVHVVLLRDQDEHPRVSAQADAIRSLSSERGGKLTELRAEGASPYERLASLVGLLDYASVYLALLTDVDPSPTPTLEALKAAGFPRLVTR